MKKALSIMLALTMVSTASICVFASNDNVDIKDEKHIELSIDKNNNLPELGNINIDSIMKSCSNKISIEKAKKNEKKSWVKICDHIVIGTGIAAGFALLIASIFGYNKSHPSAIDSNSSNNSKEIRDLGNGLKIKSNKNDDGSTYNTLVFEGNDKLNFEYNPETHEFEKYADKGNYNIKQRMLSLDNIDNMSLDELIKTLNNLEGLNGVKSQVNDIVSALKVNNWRKEQGLTTKSKSLHMVFTGNPGTGKTTTARLISKIYKELGVVSKGQFVEVKREDLVAGYVGQTALKTKEVINKAKGGILFIDEAYTLANGGANDFGQEAITTILAEMENNRDDMVVIVAGYNDDMKKFINSNEGLKSRFNNYISFDDYSNDSLYNIFDKECKNQQYKLSDSDTEGILKEYLKSIKSEDNFGNARGIRNIFEKITNSQATRLANKKNLSKEDLMTITQEDIEKALGKPAATDSKKEENRVENKNTSLANDEKTLDKSAATDSKKEENKIEDKLTNNNSEMSTQENQSTYLTNDEDDCDDDSVIEITSVTKYSK